MRKMNPAVKELWLRALRSGEYQKIEGSLYYSNPRGEGPGHCALGVLCEEAAKQGLIEINPSADAHDRFVKTTPDHLVPEGVVEWADLGDFTDVEQPVMALNDRGIVDRPTTFEDVATFIEEKF